MADNISNDEIVTFRKSMNAFAVIGTNVGDVSVYAFAVDPEDEGNHLADLDEKDAIDEVRDYDFDCCVQAGRVTISECETSVALCAMLIDLSTKRVADHAAGHDDPPVIKGLDEAIAFGELIARREAVIRAR